MRVKGQDIILKTIEGKAIDGGITAKKRLYIEAETRDTGLSLNGGSGGYYDLMFRRPTDNKPQVFITLNKDNLAGRNFGRITLGLDKFLARDKSDWSSGKVFGVKVYFHNNDASGTGEIRIDYLIIGE